MVIELYLKTLYGRDFIDYDRIYSFDEIGENKDQLMEVRRNIGFIQQNYFIPPDDTVIIVIGETDDEGSFFLLTLMMMKILEILA